MKDPAMTPEEAADAARPRTLTACSKPCFSYAGGGVESPTSSFANQPNKEKKTFAQSAFFQTRHARRLFQTTRPRGICILGRSVGEDPELPQVARSWRWNCDALPRWGHRRARRRARECDEFRTLGRKEVWNVSRRGCQSLGFHRSFLWFEDISGQSWALRRHWQ